MPRLLRAVDITKIYPKKVDPALTRSCLSIGPGEIVALVGHNGAGKSTLLDILGGLSRPSSGRVDISVPSREIGWCPQREIVDWSLTVEQNIALGLELRQKTRRAERSQLLASIAETMGLIPFLRRTAETLSGGELRRTQIARAIAGEPTLLLLDEPTTGLDPAGIDVVFDHLERRRQGGASAVISTHETSRFAAYCTRVIAMDTGVIVADEPAGAFAKRGDDPDDLWSAYDAIRRGGAAA
ncbi:ABC transporter ATP-binding protein [Frondihabitans cladoniiphilus]|uniref:ATP-binding cassette domain-containing protein n=1 Tax=Frondihabitans cladoniiphilus TaxID=715785 RepID=A0ABP8VYK4_9MICO